MSTEVKDEVRNADPDAFDHLVYMRIFEGCNLHCDHCFIPSNPKRMQIGDIASAADKIKGFAKAGDRILVQWHGGEPTALGPDFFANAIETLVSSAPEFEWIHGIQTNLMNYDDNWKHIFKKYFNGSIGVSWDPKIRLLRKGAQHTNDQYESIFWDQMSRLVADDISPYLVMTGTKILFEEYTNPLDLFKMLESRGIRQAHIERLTKTGYARDSWDRIGLSNLEYSRYMSRWARAYKRYQDTPRFNSQGLNMSPFDGLFETVEKLKRGEAGGYGCLSGACDSKFHTIDANGYKFGCTAINSEVDNRNASESIIQIVDITAERTKRVASCGDCRFRPICNTGCMASAKVDDSGECSGGFQLFEAVESIHAAI